MRATLGALDAAVSLFAGACGSVGDSSTVDTQASAAIPDAADEILITELQMVGSRNSYHVAPDEEILELVGLVSVKFAELLDQSHASLTSQLEDFGIPQLELDLCADPEGGLFAQLPVLPLVGLPADSGVPELDEPGFKVMHAQDLDFAATCPTFVLCLTEIRAWSVANPRHVALAVTFEIRTPATNPLVPLLESAVAVGDLKMAKAIPMTPELFEALEAEILSVFPKDRTITPDEVRAGHETLDAAVQSGGWPDLGTARGRVIFVLVDSGVNLEIYRAGAAALEGKLLFTSAAVGAPDGAFAVLDDPIGQAEEIGAALESGYLVRTRADDFRTDPVEGDKPRRDAAFASGAHYVSSNFYDVLPEGYDVELPGRVAAVCNPVSATSACDDHLD